jgi:Cu-Zn family superoxide dismutase
MKWFITAWVIVVAVGASVVVADFVRASGSAQAGGSKARAVFHDVNGAPVGTAKLTEEDGTVQVRVVVHDLAPGFHGFHVHGVGSCVPPFTSAGGHFNPGAASHPAHAGDMPVLVVGADGTGEARFTTDGYEVGDLFDGDGSALIIHAGPDNYANIPSRYDPDPDATTLGTGDAGGRAACAVVRG